MRPSIAASALLALASLGTLLADRSAAAPPAAAYVVDPVHSSVIFRVHHFGAGYFYGRFDDVSGKVVLDDQDPAKSSVDVEIKAESIDTNNAKRDGHLRSPDFFNAKQFPTISFKSERVRKSGEEGYEVEGKLTLHGETRPLAATFTRTGTGKGPDGKVRAGGETTFTVKRSDFGMKYMPEGIGDEVRLTVSLEAIAQ
jgi:polyisoprenoid-binding protein YceI